MTPPITYELRMDPNNIDTLIDILKRNEERCKALAKLRHTTEAETVVLIGEAAVCQYAYLQLEGVYYENPTGAPDWSAAEASGKLPSDPLMKILTGDDGAAHEAGTVDGCEACQTAIQPTPAPKEAAQPFPAQRRRLRPQP